jgi:hypothetical protein
MLSPWKPVTAGDNAYACSLCDAKVDAAKRLCLRSTPPTLFVHLKRFEFDFDTMAKRKVDSYCEFPLSLDLYPFSEAGLAAGGTSTASARAGAEGEEGADGHSDGADGAGGAGVGVAPAGVAAAGTPASVVGAGTPTVDPNASPLAGDGVAEAGAPVGPSGVPGAGVGAGVGAGPDGAQSGPPSPEAGQWQYTLTGVVIHSGTSEAGHYFSLIREPNTGAWLEFNDHTVRPFPLSRMEAEAFGGMDTTAGWGRAPGEDDIGPEPLLVPRTQSAYMLIYQRSQGEGLTVVQLAAAGWKGGYNSPPLSLS